MPRKYAIGLLLLLLVVSPAFAQRRRAARPPAIPDATPAGWLRNHGYPLIDMQPLRAVIGNASVVGLGDATHGTHEFFEIKLRMIDFLVREMNFTVVAMEGPFADFNRLNDYILGGGGDPHIILLHRDLGYWFWASEEIVTLAEWLRNYNATRGDRPPVQIVGFDVTDEKGAADIAIAYINSVDPASPTDDMEGLRANLLAHESEFVARSSQRAFDAALQAATVAVASMTAPSVPAYFAWRDENMATNAMQIRQRWSNGRLLLWGHQEHLGKTIDVQNVKPMGKRLAEHFGDDYFAIGTSAGEGSFNVLDALNIFVTIAPFSPMTDDSYERDFRSAAIPLLLIPLRIDLPEWLATAHHLRGGSAKGPINTLEVLRQKLDAIIYIDQTTRSNSFW